MHIEGRLNYPKAVDTAPFATESAQLNEDKSEGYSETKARLKVNNIVSLHKQSYCQ